MCLRAGLALSLALAGQAVLLPHSSATTTLAVSTTADSSPGDGACGDAGITTVPSPLSLREATCLANNIGGETTISVPAGNYILTEGELRLGDEPGQTTTIVGAGTSRTGTVIDAGGQSRVLELDFNLTGGITTSISGITITGGWDDTYGGAGILAGSGNSDLPDSLTISDSDITGNQANTGGSTATDRPGGGVQFIGGSLTVSNSIIGNNSSGTSPGSGVFYQDGVAGGSLTVAGSTFTGNAAVAGSANGGALALGGGSYTVSATRFIGNTVSGGSARGAGIWSQDGALTVTGSTFTGNTVTGTGGAVAVEGGSAVLHYNRFTGNGGPTGSAVSRGSGTVDATDNWWGCNTGPGTAGCDTVTGGPTVSPRLVLTATASPATVTGPNGTSTITASLAQNSLGSAIGPGNLGAFAGLPVSWSDPLPSGATVGAASSAVSSGAASVGYNSGSSSGPGHVLATLDNGTATATIAVNRAPAVTVNPSNQTVNNGNSVSFSAAASGFPTPTVRWQRSVGGGSFVDISGATSTTYTFTVASADNGNSYRAVFSNAAGSATSTAATLTVNTAPTISSSATTTFTVGSAGSFTVTTTGSPNATLTTVGTLPAWLSFNDNGNGTGTLAGTPPAGSGGTYTWSFKATGTAGSTTQAFTLAVNESPTITSADHATFRVGSAGIFTVTTVAGFPVATALSKTGSLPSGVTFTDNGNGTATLAGTPGAGTSGSYPITISASNGASTPATQSFTLTVVASPVFTSADHSTFVVGSAGSFTVTTSGGAGPVAITETGTLPSGVTFTDNGDGTATLAGTPAAGTGGSYALTFTASDGITPNGTQLFTLTVNQPPAITSTDHATFTTGVADSFTVTTAPGVPAATTITKTGSLPAGVTFTDNGDGTATLAGTATTGGSFPITIKASNGVAPDATQSFTLTVNSAPSISSADHTTFAVGSAGSFTVTTSPGVPAATTVTKTGALPSGVTFTDNGDGTATLAGIPAAGTGGTYALSIKAQNSTGFTTQSFTLTVNEKASITSADHTTFVVGTAGSFTMTTVAGYPTATTLTETGALPSGITFTDNGDGTSTLAGTPAAGTAGSYPLTLSATNAAGTRQQSFTLTVTPANASPVITSADHATFAFGAAGSFTVTTTAGYPTATTLTKTGSLPSGVTFTDNGDGTATLAGTPAAAGAFSITITASNGATTDATQSFMLTVTKVPAITSADHTSFILGTAGNFTVTTTAGYPVATMITETGSLPSGVSFTDNGDGTATLVGTPTSGTAGSYPLTITAANSAGNRQQSFTLTVQPTNASPVITSADHTTFAKGSAGTFTVTTTGYPTPAITKTKPLPVGVTFTDNGNGTATIAGTPTATGNFVIIITANNGVSPNATQGFTLTVTAAPAITSANTVTFNSNVAGQSFTVTTTGFPAAAITKTGSLPAGVTFFDKGDGTAFIGGSPASGTGGVYVLSLTATNPSGTGTQSFTLTVTQPPVIISSNQASFASGSFIVTTAAGYPVATTITETGALPTGVTFADNGDGTATLTGSTGTAGSYSVTLTASNGVSPAASQTLTIQISAAQQSPTLTVTTTADVAATAGACGNIRTTKPPSPLSLREAICIANNLGGSVQIQVPAGHYTLANGELVAGKFTGQDITIQGAGSASTIIDGNHASRVLHFDTSQVGGVIGHIRGVTITNGRDSNTGGAGILAGSGSASTIDSLDISNSVISNNQADFAQQAGTDRFGGGVRFFGGSLTLTNVSVSGNQSFSSAGSGVYYRAIGTTGQQSLTVTGSTFTSNGTANSATSGVSGGALALVAGSDGDTVYTVRNTVFSGNASSSTSAEQAAGAAIFKQTGALVVTGSTFTGNTVSGTGGLGGSVLYSGGSSNSLHDNRFTGNSGVAVLNVGSTIVNAIDNWWGCEVGPGGTGCDNTSGQVITSPRLLLTVTTSPTRIIGPQATATIIAALTTDSADSAIAAKRLSAAFNGLPVTFADPDGDATVSVQSVNLNSGTATNTYQSHTTFGLDNDSATLDNGTIAFTVEVDKPPAITSTNNATFTVGSASTFSITTTGYPNAVITKSGSLPGGLSFHDNGDGTATLAGTPATGTVGIYPIIFTAVNGAPPDTTQNFTLTVSPSPG